MQAPQQAVVQTPDGEEGPFGGRKWAHRTSSLNANWWQMKTAPSPPHGNAGRAIHFRGPKLWLEHQGLCLRGGQGLCLLGGQGLCLRGGRAGTSALLPCCPGALGDSEARLLGTYPRTCGYETSVQIRTADSEPSKNDFSKEDKQMANKYAKRCSKPLAISKMHIKTTMRCNFTPTRTARVEPTDKIQYGQGCGETEPSHAAGEMWNGAAAVKRDWRCLKKVNAELAYSPVILLLGLYPQSTENEYPHKNLYMNVHTALFLTA